MKKGWIILGVVLLVVLMTGGSCVGRYNTFRGHQRTDRRELGSSRERAAAASGSDSQPRGYGPVDLRSKRREIFEEVANARSRLLGASSPAQAAAANAGLTMGLGRLLAISEAYPQLRSNENFIRLQDELAGSENRIAVERRRYNDAVRVYNTEVRQFPNNLMAGMFGFGDREYFEAEEGAQEVPVVEF